MKPFSFPRSRPKKDGTVQRSATVAAHSPDDLTLFRHTRERALQAGEEILRAVAADLQQGERGELEAYWEALPFYFDVVKTADAATRGSEGMSPASKAAPPPLPSYLVSARFLATCHAFLMSQPHGFEGLHLVTGIKVSQMVRTLDQMMPIALAQQSAVGAVADLPALQRALIELDEWGHVLHGLFHGHPGRGALDTRPSSTDLTTHERFERSYPLVGAIFVKDGFVRFFGHRPFTITLYGKGVERIHEDEHVFKIHQRCPVSDDTPQCGGERV